MTRTQLKFFYSQVLLRGKEVVNDAIPTESVNMKCRAELANEVSMAILASTLTASLTEPKTAPDGTGQIQLASIALGMLWQNDLLSDRSVPGDTDHYSRMKELLAILLEEYRKDWCLKIGTGNELFNDVAALLQVIEKVG